MAPLNQGIITDDEIITFLELRNTMRENWNLSTSDVVKLYDV